MPRPRLSDPIARGGGEASPCSPASPPQYGVTPPHGQPASIEPFWSPWRPIPSSRLRFSNPGTGGATPHQAEIKMGGWKWRHRREEEHRNEAEAAAESAGS